VSTACAERGGIDPTAPQPAQSTRILALTWAPAANQEGKKGSDVSPTCEQKAFAECSQIQPQERTNNS